MSFSFVGQRIVWTAKLWSFFSDLAPRMVSIMNFLQQFGPEEVILFLLWTPTSLWSRHCSGGFHLGELRPVDKRMYPLFFFSFSRNWTGTGSSELVEACWDFLELHRLVYSPILVSGEVLPSWKTFGPVDQEIYPRLFLKINFDRDFAEVKIGFQELWGSDTMLELRENGENKMENKFREENQLLI